MLPEEQYQHILAEIRYFERLQIRVDNGPEFISKIFMSYFETEGIEINYIQPGKPSQNGYIERFNKTFGEDVLDAYIFRNLEEVQQIAEDFGKDYNKFHMFSFLEPRQT